MHGYHFDETIDEEMRQRAVAILFEPGDKVVLADREAGGELRRLLSCGDGGVLKVASVKVEGTGKASYGFEGVEGLYPYGAFVDVRPPFHVYGAMVVRDGEIWVVELDPASEEPKAGRSVRVSGVTGRHLAWNNGINGLDDVAAYAADGAAGEFSLLQESDGSWNLVAIPWSCEISDEEREAAEEALAGRNNAASASRLN